jgi:hypothetical protein
MTQASVDEILETLSPLLNLLTDIPRQNRIGIVAGVIVFTVVSAAPHYPASQPTTISLPPTHPPTLPDHHDRDLPPLQERLNGPPPRRD